MSKFDVFISHASEDKESIAKPLAVSLSEYGVRVWYDEFTLSLGDSLSRSIDKGLAASNFGLVILSPAFFDKGWTEYELRGLTAKEIGKDKVILPVWHDVNRKEVLKYSPPLADKVALVSSRLSTDELAIQVIKIIRPDLFTKIHKRLALIEQIKKAKIEKIKPTKLKLGPAIHQNLPPQLIQRIRLIRASLLGVYTHSMEFWVEGFKRDAHPSREIGLWEHVAACYQEYAAMTELTSEQHIHAYKVVFSLCTDKNSPKLKEHLKNLPKDARKIITNLVKYNYPLYDIEEQFPESTEGFTEEWQALVDKIDVEDFSSGEWFEKNDF